MTALLLVLMQIDKLIVSCPRRSRQITSCKLLLLVLVQIDKLILHDRAARAAKAEVLFLHHMASCHNTAISILESEGSQRQITDRAEQHKFWDSAREALGELRHVHLQDSDCCLCWQTRPMRSGLCSDTRVVDFYLQTADVWGVAPLSQRAVQPHLAGLHISKLVGMIGRGKTLPIWAFKGPLAAAV